MKDSGDLDQHWVVTTNTRAVMLTVDFDENLKPLTMGAAKVGDRSRACSAISDNRQGSVCLQLYAVRYIFG